MPPDPPSTLDLSGLLRHERQALAHIAAGRPLRRVLEELSFAVESTSVGMLASVLLLEPDGLHLTHGAAPSLPAEYNAAVEHLPVGPFAGSCGAAAHTREAVYVADIATDPRWENYRHIALPFNRRCAT
ncbi:MAG: GAF domain-containing protein, partial [Comamonadaceae bacterium]